MHFWLCVVEAYFVDEWVILVWFAWLGVSLWGLSGAIALEEAWFGYWWCDDTLFAGVFLIFEALVVKVDHWENGDGLEDKVHENGENFSHEELAYDYAVMLDS